MSIKYNARAKKFGRAKLAYFGHHNEHILFSSFTAVWLFARFETIFIEIRPSSWIHTFLPETLKLPNSYFFKKAPGFQNAELGQQALTLTKHHSRRPKPTQWNLSVSQVISHFHELRRGNIESVLNCWIWKALCYDRSVLGMAAHAKDHL